MPGPSGRTIDGAGSCCQWPGGLSQGIKRPCRAHWGNDPAGRLAKRCQQLGRCWQGSMQGIAGAWGGASNASL